MIELRIPKEHANDDYVLVSKVYINTDEKVTEDQELIEIETSKTTIVLSAPSEGIAELIVKEDQEIEVNSVYCRLYSKQEWSNEKINSPSETVAEKLSAGSGTDRVVSDAARELLKDDPSLVNSESMWVTSRAMRSRPNEKKVAKDSTDLAKKPINVDLNYSNKRTSIRKRAEIGALRASGGGPFQSVLGINIEAQKRIVSDLIFNSSLLDIACYETSKLLDTEFNDLNGFYISDSEIGVYDEVHAGISLDDHSNLVVARVEDAANLNLQQIQKRLGDLFAKFEDDALDQNDLMPTTFTISDLSNTSCIYMLPLLNDHQALIVGIVRQAKGFNLYAAFDHRVSEGLRVSKFLEQLKQRCEAHFNLNDDQVQQDRTLIVCSFCQKTLDEEFQVGNRDRGFIQITSEDGVKLCCRTCFDGW